MQLKFTLLLVVFFVFNYTGKAQKNQHQFSQLDITSGLSNNHVNCIYKDFKGFMWFGTLSGLNRYDGYKFKVFKSDAKDSTTLSDDFIVSIFEGPNKKLWIQTKTGFNIYDPLTEHFSRSFKPFIKSIGLPDDWITSMKKDRQGTFWFSYHSSGVYSYDPSNKITRNFSHNRKGSFQLLYSNEITDFTINAKGNIWIMYRDGTFELLDPRQNKIVYRSELLKKANGALPVTYHLSVDRDNDLWFFTTAVSLGVYYFNTENNKLIHIDKNSDGPKLKSDFIFNVLQDNSGLIWIATDHGGINLLDKRNFEITYLFNREEDHKSLGQNSVICLYKDDSGIMWAGTYKKGVSYYHENIIRFPVYRHYASDPRSLSFDDINRFAEDAAGNIWIGTNGGGLIYYNTKTGSYKKYQHNDQDPNSLANDVVVSLYVDHEQKLWIGTYWGGLDCFDGHRFIHYRHQDKNPASLSDDRVWEIMEDSANRLWVGTLAGGLNRFDQKTHTFYHYAAGKNSITCNYTSALYEDCNKNIWIGGFQGIDVLLNKTGNFIHYRHDDKKPEGLLNDYIYTIKQDSRKLMWIGTNQGLSILNLQTGKFYNLKKDDGLPDKVVLDIIEDDNHSMWISTPNGLSNVTIGTKDGDYKFSFKNFDETDGLQGRDFNENAAYKMKNGTLLFGGANGFNMFRPANIPYNNSKVNLVFTEFQVFNKSINANEPIDGRVILDKSVTETKNIILHYNENVFAIEFASLNYFNSDKLSYQYMMDGFDKGWLGVDNKIRKATYTNLDPGNYTFKVRVSNPELPGRVDSIALKITVLPPFWKTSFAYFFYVVVFLGMLFYIRYRGIQKLKKEFAFDQERKEVQRMLETERQDAQRLHELNLMKIKFFTNVSHEFRTPLSLIISPVEKLLKSIESPDQNYQLQIIKRNARRLLNMVNQLLDFRKMEVQELKLHTTQGDIIKFIKEVSNSFTDIAENNKITYVFDSDIEYLETKFDQDKIERIFFNLLSNAFKFTHSGGYVSVLLSKGASPDHDINRQVLEIKVTDTGIGIPKEKLEKVFERFFQNDVPGAILNQGSGIGLSIVKEFVKMHDGEIMVESEIDQGSCFIVRLPLIVNRAFFKDEEMKVPGLPALTTGKAKKDLKKPTVLLIEDNDDFRFYLKDNLKEYFFVIEASNGKEGWQKALSLHPNLIVSDINMPEMNGIDLCLKIKGDSRTTHIPMILLTALPGEEQELRGLETGASDYMTKPFNFEILLSKLKNLLLQQDLMLKTYKKQVQINPSDIIVESPDEVFIQKSLQIIERNISNVNFSVEELSSEMCMSRVTLYKKSLELTGKSPVELIRSIRLKRATQLLENGYLTISQVSYKVGFRSQKYFTKSFKAEFNMLPSDYQANRELESQQ